MKKHTSILVSVLAVSALGLAACTPPNQNDSSEPKTTQATAAQETESAETTAADAAAEGISFENAFVKAKPAADAEDGRDMTGIFGTIVNNTDQEIEVNGFSIEIAGNETQPTMTELHEVVDGQMQMKEGGYVIPAGESHELKPGADHMMIMGYDEAIMPGATVTITIMTADGQSVEVKDVPVREVGSGDESYGADGELQGHGSGMESDSMDHEGHDHEGHNH